MLRQQDTNGDGQKNMDGLCKAPTQMSLLPTPTARPLRL